ncbi:response regulator [Aquabacterium sp. CECT 9606]|uniref:response regulator n=1 Tax=Aquabacterium sp. CECT 9606 TaxID=2845822 RepID=UPI001E5C0170|nr:response regulator [Aquabacterium sp. CECT 9606]CAH0356054.1 hypothetical protein AQB9606_04522 [Aquabacterium sp. CECT 9606]
MSAVIQGPHAVLMVTKKTSSRELPWADLAGSASEALAKWQQTRHPFVFADFGELGDGMTGARLAAALRKESIDVVVILLADQVQPHHRVWAQRNGATDVIERTAKAITACLPSSVKAPRVSEFPSGFPADESPDAVAATVSDRLQKYGRMGPARTLVVRDALDALVAEKGATPTVNELAKRVAKEILRSEDRTAFLNSFNVVKGR